MFARRVTIWGLAVLLLSTALFADFDEVGAFTEPSMATYTAYPVFLSASVQPNIMIILDNSGSMNYNAYGAYPGDGGIVNDSYLGEPYQNLEKRVASGQDDAEERALDGLTYYANDDLDIGRDISSSYSDMTTGLRFSGLKIPRGAVITKAYIEFTTKDVYAGAQSTLQVAIHGEAADNAAQFATINRNISSRSTTMASVDWDLAPWNVAGETHQTPDLKDIVQEIVNRPAWAEGNALVFILTNKSPNPSSGRMAASYEYAASRAPLLHIEVAREDATKYYGYFNPDYFYYWNSSKFDHKYKKIAFEGDPYNGGYWRCQDLNGNTVHISNSNIVSEGLWDGNWMNWASMRRIDVLRKVLFGGLATARTGGGNQVNYGETPTQTTRTFVRRFDSTGAVAVTPYHGNYYYGTGYGYLYVGTNVSPFSTYLVRRTLAVQKSVRYEPEDFYNYDSGDNLAGVLQKVGDKARWGNEVFMYGTGSRQSGGRVTDTIGTNMVSLITNLQNIGCDTNTPLAESYYVATQYFKQEDPATGLDYANGVAPNDNVNDDPYYNGQYFDCAKSFVIMLTDGASTKDAMIPAFLKDYDQDGRDLLGCDETIGSNCDYATGGTDYLDDVALYARTTDLRPDLGGDQNLILYTIYAFGDETEARDLLKDAARNGGFEDKNGNNRPDGDYTDPAADRIEWDADGDGNPDTYYEASNGYKLERELLRAITDILKRASSGTAVSVLATSSEGEGTLVQAYFKPSVTEGTEDIKWVGYLHGLWVDSLGRTREDTLPQGDKPGLTLNHDKIVEFFYDEASNQASFHRFEVNANGDKAFTDTNGNGVKDDNEPYIYTTHRLDELQPIWEAGKRLSLRDPGTRKIMTFMDNDLDGVVDPGEYVDFAVANNGTIRPFLGVKNASYWTYLDRSSDATPQTRADNLIRFVRGDASGYSGTPDLRNRTIGGNIWRLGDIVHSTPVSIGRPVDNYGLIYGDQSYQAYYTKYRDREQVVYVGGNDGMLHAFYMGKYVEGDNPATTTGEQIYFDKAAGTTAEYGDELWAYIPQNLLPHLKWLADPDYTHVYFVDLKPRLVDAQIFAPGVDANGVEHPNGWGTVLLGGLNMGGKEISVQDDFPEGGDAIRSFNSCYFALDVTNPHKPQLLWERTYANTGLSTSFPTVGKVGNNWYMFFGSGPTDYNGSSTQNGHILIADLETGALLRDYTTAESKAFLGSPITVDVGLNYSVDTGYIGESYFTNQGWKGVLYRLRVPKTVGDWRQASTTDVYDTNPANWTFSKMVAVDAPITAAPAASTDSLNNLWVYFGTGRYFSDEDKTTTDTQYFFGVKDPYYNAELYATSTDLPTAPLTASDLVNSTSVQVYTDGSVDGITGIDYWSELLLKMNDEDGWYFTLLSDAGLAVGERVLNKPTILGGIVFDTTFIPNPDPCGFSGDSNLLGVYYQTGTAYTEEVFLGASTEVAGQNKREVSKKIEVGVGRASGVSIHVGKQEGATGYVQQSTGIVEALELNPAFNVRSGFIYWRER